VAACRKCNKVRADTAYAAWLGHPYYLDKSQKLSPAVREKNAQVSNTLADIERVIVIRDRK
jgi:hypothetical protein